MKKKLLITIYDVFALLFIATFIIAFLTTEKIEYHDFTFKVNDTIRYDRYNINRGLELVSVGDHYNSFSYVDKYGNEISRAECMDNYRKYGGKGEAYRDSLIVDPDPRIAIKELTTRVGFINNYKSQSNYTLAALAVILVKFIMILFCLILIRQVLHLTIKGKIFSEDGTRIFKLLFFLSIAWVVAEYLGKIIVFEGATSKSSYIPTMYGFDGGIMGSYYSIEVDYFDVYYHLIFIVSTFCLYMAFKFGQKVKSENDLTI